MSRKVIPLKPSAASLRIRGEFAKLLTAMAERVQTPEDGIVVITRSMKVN
jgi:hypothetical protein